MILAHPLTRETISSFQVSTPHAILLTGNEASGRSELALELAQEILGKNLDNHPYFKTIEPDGGKSITIDQVRTLQKFVRLKTTGRGSIRRVVLIINAHTMTTEAQNALLKVLEEPPADTVLILTALGDRRLKPTIYSRVQRVHVRPLTREQASSYAAEVGNTTNWESALALSGGDSQLFQSLLQNNESHELKSAIQTAKQLLSSSKFEQLARIDELTRDKDLLRNILIALKRIASAKLHSATHSNDFTSRIHWLNSYHAIYQAESDLAKNANPKLVLSDLFLTI
jgi:DNA polymerase III delta prime subunit